MRRLAAFTFFCVIAALPGSAEMIDRVVATVNGRPILMSDVDEALRYEALVEGKAHTPVSQAEYRAALDRLIDQELLRQQMGEMAPEVNSNEEEAKLEELRKQHQVSPEQWRAQIAAYGLDESGFAARFRNQLRTMAFLDRRLRPSVLVERTAVEAYYRDTLLPKLRKSGSASEPPLTEVQREIREVLTQQGMDDMVTTWLRNLRQQSRVRVLLEDAQVASTASVTGAK